LILKTEKIVALGPSWKFQTGPRSEKVGHPWTRCFF